MDTGIVDRSMEGHAEYLRMVLRGEVGGVDRAPVRRGPRNSKGGWTNGGGGYRRRLGAVARRRVPADRLFFREAI